LGTSEFYSVLDEINEIGDSLVIHLEDSDGGAGELILFVTTKDDEVLADEARDLINQTLRRELSPRHVPDVIRQVKAIPRTLTGKRQEIPVKRVLLDPTSSVNAAVLAEPDNLWQFRELARERLALHTH
jgi:acetoacetyl-CoA synthetase